MTTPLLDKAAKLVSHLKAMRPEDRDRASEESIRQAEAEHEEFLAAFSIGHCYLCGNPLSSFSKKTPCLHWLLKPKGFKKNDLPAVAQRFGFFQAQTYLRWVANTEGFARHINDLPEEGTGGKLIELTVRYRSLEWSFSCAESDFLGHATSQHSKHPHYHFQMRIEQRPFINFSDFHVPFKEADIVGLEAKRVAPHLVKHAFPRGEGMAEVMNEASLDTLVSAGSTPDIESEALVHLSSMVMADEGSQIDGTELYNLFQEAKAKGVTVASLLHKLQNTSTRVVVSPGSGVVEQAPRSGRKKDL
ncbi:MAG: hypothetical protein K0M66_05205 [Thiobacillus sp.]|nr:hypothetical protein [Thiobacillus sp.]